MSEYQSYRFECVDNYPAWGSAREQATRGAETNFKPGRIPRDFFSGS